MKRLIPVMMVLLLVACQQGGEEKVIAASNPFIGGTQGLVFDFQDFREEVFDGASDPFDIVVRVENKGEAFVDKRDVQVEISGFNPREFGKVANDLVSEAPDDIIETRKDPQGGVIPGPRVFVEFTGLNYGDFITGSTAQFPVRADVCYLYRTRGVSKLCIRENLLTPRAGGICEINENKQVFNSGAPVQIRNFKENTRSSDKVGFTFEIVNVGQGDVFERNSKCDREVRKKENRAYVIVATNLEGLQCTGLETTSNGAEGFVTLFGGSKIVSCSQRVSTRSDFEQLVNIEVIYDYEERTQTLLTVRSSGQAS